MKTLYTLILLSFFLFNSASAQFPVANFTLSDDSICANDCITLINTTVSNTPMTITWSTYPGFGVIYPSDQDTTTGCFYTAGHQYIKLIVTNGVGTDSIVKGIYVF